MSDDERTEEETSEELVDEEIEATSADDAGEDEGFLAGEVEIPQGGGCSAGTWVIILLIIAALIYIGVWQVQKSARESAEAEAAQRQEVRQTQLAGIASDITTVETGLQQGDIAGAIKTLRQMDDKLGSVQAAANQDGDTDAAAMILSIRGSVGTAVADIEQEYASLQAVADQRIGAVRTTMGVLAPAATPAPEPAEEPGDEAAGDVEATPDVEAAPDVEPAAPEGDMAPDAEPAPDVEVAPDAPPADDSGVPEGEPAMPGTELAPAG